jgi:site-specific recombinase XerD
MCYYYTNSPMPSTKAKQTKYSLPLLDDYLLNLQTNNYSDKTVYNYERDLKVFDDFLNTQVKTPLQKASKRTIQLYKAHLSSSDRKTPLKGSKGLKKLNSYSINRMLSALRSYLTYLIEMDYKTPITPEMIKLVKTEKMHPQVAELEDLIRLIEAPTKLEANKKVALRNRAMLEVLISTGMRISELVNLKRTQIDDTGKIFIMGKGKKQRFVYMTPRAITNLDRYLKTRTDNLEYLFIPYRGGRSGQLDRKISTNYLQMKIKQYREQLRINVPTSAHSLRHGFATYLAESGASPAAIQILLGHESLDTTTRYVNASDRC